MPARSSRCRGWCGRTSRSSPRSRRCISNIFGSIEAIADAKAEIFRGLEPGGAAVINRDSPQFERLQRSAARAPASTRIVSFGEHAQADARLIKSSLHAGLLDRAGAHPRQRRHLQARRARAAHRAQFAGGAGGGVACRRRSRAGRAGARRDDSRRPAAARAARSIFPAARALLIDESYNANPASMRGGAGAARPGRGRRARPAHRGARRHAGTRAARRRAARARWRSRCVANGDRPGVLLRAADARAVGGPSLRAPGRLCGERRPRSNRRCWPPSARATPSWSRDRSARGWVLSSRRCERTFASERARRRRAPRLIHALLAVRILRHSSTSSTCSATSPFRTGGAMITALSSCSCSGRGSSTICACGRARASRSAPTGRNRISSPRRARPPWAG